MSNLTELLKTLALAQELAKGMELTISLPADVSTESLVDVLTERERMLQQGFTRERDDTLTDGSLVSFATCLLLHVPRSDKLQWVWPALTRAQQAKYSERQHLVMAIAVLLAELERRDRITMRLPSTDELEIVSPAPQAVAS